MDKTVSIEKLNETIRGMLEDYHGEVVRDLKAKTEEAMAELVQTSKATAPRGRRRRHYYSNITSKTLSENSYGITKLWYVKGKDYRLTHLLNNGHALRNGGRYPGTNFLGRAVDDITAKYVRMIEEVLRQ